MTTPDYFGIADSVRQLTPPAGLEAVHQDGFSWARQGIDWTSTTRLSPAEWNGLIAQFRGLLTIDGVDLSDLPVGSPIMLKEAIVRAIEIGRGIVVNGSGTLAARPASPVDGFIYAVIETGTIAYLSQYRNGAWVNTATVRGQDGAYAAADAIIQNPALTDYVPVQVGGVSKRSRIMDAAPLGFFNTLSDGGRFAGTPDPTSYAIGAFTAPAYMTLYNGSTGAAGEKYIYNNTTHGGTAGALGENVNELISQWVALTVYRRYGTEFWTWRITQGPGTVAPLTVGGATCYLTWYHRDIPLAPVRMTNMWIKPISGTIGVFKQVETWIDGAAAAANTALLPATGWHNVASYFYDTPSARYGHTNSQFALYCTPGAVFDVAAMAMFPGHGFRGNPQQLVATLGML